MHIIIKCIQIHTYSSANIPVYAIVLTYVHTPESYEILLCSEKLGPITILIFWLYLFLFSTKNSVVGVVKFISIILYGKLK